MPPASGFAKSTTLRNTLSSAPSAKPRSDGVRETAPPCSRSAAFRRRRVTISDVKRAHRPCSLWAVHRAAAGELRLLSGEGPGFLQEQALLRDSFARREARGKMDSASGPFKTAHRASEGLSNRVAFGKKGGEPHDSHDTLSARTCIPLTSCLHLSFAWHISAVQQSVNPSLSPFPKTPERIAGE
jgi:hypothetical protein